jgi:hypothetical protein
VRPSGDRIRAYMPNSGQLSSDIRYGKPPGWLRYHLSFSVGHWHFACTLMWHRGRHLLAKTDSAANQFGAPESVEDPRGISPLVAVSAPRAFAGSQDRRAIMKTFNTLPGESNASIISLIINSVCPQCGGRMWEFQCEGRCRRNWLAEWEWANYATRSSKSRLASHAARSTR